MEGEPMSAHDRHHCKECGLALVEGRAYELGGYRWHVECFVCSVCTRKLNAETNMLVLGNGTLVCNNCSYYCNMCHTKIEKLAILTNDQAFCASCFICRNCKNPIEDLKYARTPHGIFCMSCHNVFMARKLHRQSRRTSAQSSSSLRQKQLPELPGMPRKPSSRASSTSTVPRLGSPMPQDSDAVSDVVAVASPLASGASQLEPTPSPPEDLEEEDDDDEPQDDDDDSSSEYEVEDFSSVAPRPASNGSVGASTGESSFLAPQRSQSSALADASMGSAVGSAAGSAVGLGLGQSESSYSLKSLSRRSHEPYALSGSLAGDLSQVSLQSEARSEAQPEQPEQPARDLRIELHDSHSSPRPSPRLSASMASENSFHSARQSLETPRQDPASEIDLSIFNSPPPMNLALRGSGLGGGHGSPEQGTPSKTPRKNLSLASPTAPPRSLARSPLASPTRIAPPRSPMRSPAASPTPSQPSSRPSSRPASFQSYTSSLQQSPELDLAVPKRSNLRARSPGPGPVARSRGSAVGSASSTLGGSSLTSAPGPLPISPRWRNMTHKRSFSDNETLDQDSLVRSLVVAQARIRDLESRLQEPRESMLARKSTLATLEAKQEIAKTELKALESATADARANAQGQGDAAAADFGTKLTSIKSNLEEDIAALVAEKEKLKAEVAELRDSRKPRRKEVGSGAGSGPNPASSRPAGIASQLAAAGVHAATGPSPYGGSPRAQQSSLQPPSAPVAPGGSQSAGYPSSSSASASAPSSSGPQFVTVLDQGQKDDRKKLWPWKRQRPRQVEIEEATPTAVTYLGGTGVTAAQQSAPKSTILGESLEQRAEADGALVPFLVTRCIKEVERRGLDLEGIYRKSGSKSQIDALMSYFETRSPELEHTLAADISAVTSALKQYLRYIDDPVINYVHYSEFVKAGKTQSLPLLRKIVGQLSAPHRETLRVLMVHLGRVKSNSRNLMTTHNLATVFAPTLTRDITGDREMVDMQWRNDATQMLIDCPEVFD